MIFNPRNTHIIPTLMLFAAATLPMHPLSTNSAYGDTEASSHNVLEASDEFPDNAFRVEVNPFMLQAVPPAEEGEVAGAETEEPPLEKPAEESVPEETLPEVEVSDEPLEVTEEEPVEVEVSEEPLEVVEPEEEPVVEPEKEEAPDPPEDPAPASESVSAE